MGTRANLPEERTIRRGKQRKRGTGAIFPPDAGSGSRKLAVQVHGKLKLRRVVV